MTRRQLMDRNIAFACGEQIANKNMRKHGRQAWHEEEFAAAARTTNRFLLDVPFEQGGLKGLDLSPEDRAGLGVDP